MATNGPRDSQMYDVIVLGGGFTGLTALEKLQKAGKRVLLVEAHPQVGGRCRTVTTTDGRVSDVGGTHFGVLQTRVMKLVQRFHEVGKIDLVKWHGVNPVAYQELRDGTVMQTPREQCLWGIQGLPDYKPPLEVLQMFSTLYWVSFLESLVNIQAPWDTPFAKWLDNITVGDWVSRQDIPEFVKEMYGMEVSGLHSIDMKDVSLLYWLWFNATKGGMMIAAMDGERSHQQYVTEQGMGTLAQRLADDIGAPILTSTPVRRVVHTSAGALVECENGEVLKAKKVIVAVSPSAADHIEFVPPLAPERTRIHTQPPGHAIKSIVHYEGQFTKGVRLPWWKRGANYQAWGGCPYQPSRPLGSPYGIEWGLDVSDPAKGQYRMGMFLTPAWVRDHSGEGTSMLKKDISKTISKFLKHPHVEAAHVEFMNWKEEPYIHCGPFTNMGCNVLSKSGGVFNQPEVGGGLYFASTEYATMYTGHIEGAINAGEFVADQVMGRDVSPHLGRKTAWVSVFVWGGVCVLVGIVVVVFKVLTFLRLDRVVARLVGSGLRGVWTVMKWGARGVRWGISKLLRGVWRCIQSGAESTKWFLTKYTHNEVPLIRLVGINPPVAKEEVPKYQDVKLLPCPSPQPLPRTSNRALVLSGGGALGAFQLGVLEGLVETHSWDLVSGTSVGAVAATAFGHYPVGSEIEALASLKKIWGSITTEDIFPEWGMGLLEVVVQGSLLDNRPLSRLVDNIADPEVILESGRKVRVTVVEMESGELQIKGEKDSDFLEFAKASCMPPVVVPAWEIHDRHFVDGGVLEELPITAALDAGYTRIDVISNMPLTPLQQKPFSGNPGDAFARGVQIMIANATHLQLQLVAQRLGPNADVHFYFPAEPLAAPTDTQIYDKDRLIRYMEEGRHCVHRTLDEVLVGFQQGQ